LVEKFLWVTVSLQCDEELGLREEGLEDYAKLRFKNNFADIELARSPRKTVNEERNAVHGIMSFSVWTVGTDYPVAYHISVTAGTMGPSEELTVFDRYTNAVLGYCSKSDLVDVVKRAIDSLMEDCAVDFFKARGEL
jgi:hypothetical protein